MTENYDFVVIGGGSGGIAAARRAAQHGARAVLFETAKLGGTCVNVGCVPKKVMWNAAQIHDALALADDYGFNLGAAADGCHWPRLKTARDAYIGRLNQIYADNLAADGVEVVRAAARFRGADQIEAGGQVYRAGHILIATGSAPVMPSIPGAELGISSDGFFDLATQPMKPLLIGAGYIATELAGVLHGLGSRVTMLLRKDRLLRAFDHALGEHVLAHMRDAGVTIKTGISCAQIFRAADGSLGYRAAGDSQGDSLAAAHDAGAAQGNSAADANTADSATSGYDCVIFAISRRPNAAALHLGRAGLATDARGFIGVDEFQNTAVAGLYAVGDVTTAPPLTPVAIAAGRRLADRLFGDQPQARADFATIPSVVFSHPPIGTVGLSEQRAAQIHGAAHIKVYQSRFVNMRYAVSAHKPRTLVKLITVAATQKVIGCHVVGDGADEMLQGFAVALKLGATKTDFDNTIAIHPTAAEELVTLR